MNRLLGTLLVAAFLIMSVRSVSAQTTMANYTAYPPFINQTVPPLVMLVMSKDHRMFIKGYNDMQDLDNNVSTGVSGIETTYADYIDYYGYFDPKKCYTYNTGVTPNRFDPAAWAVASGGFRYTCTNQWSGNFLNWATMTRMDIVRKVLYGGKRGLDNSGSSTSVTTLRRTWLPQDAHSFAKAYQNGAGRPNVDKLTPKSWTTITFCNTNTALFDSQAQGRTLVVNGYYPYAGSTNNKQCTQTFDNSGVAYTPAAGDTYNVEVKVCDPSYLETTCEEYKSGAVSWWKPTGLMQRMGLNRQGTPDNTTDDRVNMKFALITGSYGRHISGGVLRSKMTTVNSEIVPATGVVDTTNSKVIRTIDNFMLRQYSNASGWYDGDSGTTGNCGSAAPASGAGGSKSSGNLFQPTAGTNDDKCISWGNPIGEMFYEALRYFLGKATQTTIFQAATPDIGYRTSAPTATQPFLAVDSWDDPYTTGGCPYCSKPFILTLSDAFPSFDSDHLPGSNWAATVSPNDTGLDVQTLMTPIETNDGQATAFIGEYKNGAPVYDEACTSKTGTFRYIRSLCPEEPTKQGAYYLAGLAHYGKITDLRGALGADTGNIVKQNITTYSVVTNSPFPILEYTINNKRVQLIPIFHDDCPPSTSPTYNQIPAVSGCSAPSYHIGSSDGSKGALVDFQICDSNDEAGNGYEFCYDVMWDDAEYGWDYDLDVRYRLYVDTNPSTALACTTIPRPAGCSGTGGSGTAPTADTIRIRTKAIYASAGHTDFAGYLINGVSNTPPATGSPSSEGEYYMIRCGGAAGGNDCDTYDINSSTADGMGNSVATKDFTVTGSTTDVLKDPFWYAAKYGGFEDKNGNNVPDNGSTSSPGPCTTTPGSFCEWDRDLDGVPDTYFYAANPIQLEAKLAAAFAAILNRASSGTAASVLASSTTGEGALYQSFFFPVQFESTTGNEIKYSGYTQALFVDAFGNLREDTNGDGRLIYTDDRIIVTRYDVAQTTTVADLYADTNGDGKADGGPVTTNVKLVDLKPIWEAGRQLALTDEANRRILTWIDKDNNNVVASSEVISYDNLGTHTADLTPYLNTDATYTATKLIQFTRGCDPWATGSTCTGISTYRDRRLTTKDATGTPVLKIWKFGDPVYATPTIIGAPKERYDALYGDPTYSGFFRRWKDRRQVAYVGANDGMLHAFNVGRYYPGDDTGAGSPGVEHGWFTDGGALADGRTPKRGDENWAFIPQELLPHLRWLADPAYSHVYYVDLKPKITDVRIFTQEAACGGGTTPTAPGCKHPGGWGTILIGGFRLGGSCGNCSTTVGVPNAAPMVLNKDFNYDGDTTDPGDTRTFLSSFFVLDITDPESDPVLLWSFSHTDLGLTMSYPAVLRVRGAGSKADPTGEKWFAAFGSGPTAYDAGTSQHSKLFIVDVATGPSSAAKNDLLKLVDGTAVVSDGAGGTVATANSKSFVGDLVSVDKDLDFREDAIFAGQVVNDTRGGSVKPWRGLLIRLTTGCQAGASSCQTDPANWGIAGGSGRTPTQILDQFANASSVTQTLGPIATAPSLVVDDQSNLWLFSGTGRYFSVGASPADSSNTDTQYLVGVKDRLFSGTCASQTSMTNCISPQTAPPPARFLVDLSAATVCVVGTVGCTTATQVSNVTQLGGGGTGSFANLVSLVQSQDGWFTTLPTSGERMVSTPVVLGGIVLYPTFVPNSDLCVAAGNSYLYALYYKTGGPYSEPVIGTAASGTQVARSTSLGQGLGTSVALHIGVQGTGGAGGGSQSGLTGCSQSSVGSLNCVSIDPAGIVTSRWLSWRDQRD